MIGRSLNADLRKMKGTSVILAHLLLPIITSVIFLIYYFFSPWNENMKVIAFYQAIGAGLPVLIGIFTASVMEQEQNAGNFQNLLSLPDKMCIRDRTIPIDYKDCGSCWHCQRYSI